MIDRIGARPHTVRVRYLSIREQVAVQQAGAAGAASARNVLYGCAEMQTPSEFLAQVAQLGGN